MAKKAKNPYVTLGVGREATPAQVKRAHHRKVQETHPDKGGDAGRFREVQHAYQLLADPARRERYDRTGDAEEDAPDNRGGKTFQLLHGVLCTVLQPLLEAGVDPAGQDLLGFMTKALRERADQLKRTAVAIDKAVKALPDLAGRFTVADGRDNLLAAACRIQARQLAEQWATVYAEEATVAEALGLLKTYQYRRDAAAKVKSQRPDFMAFVYGVRE